MQFPQTNSINHILQSETTKNFQSHWMFLLSMKMQPGSHPALRLGRWSFISAQVFPAECSLLPILELYLTFDVCGG